MPTETGESPFSTCDHCGDRFDLGVSYPVVVDETEGSLELYSFCDESCERAWGED